MKVYRDCTSLPIAYDEYDDDERAFAKDIIFSIVPLWDRDFGIIVVSKKSQRRRENRSR